MFQLEIAYVGFRAVCTKCRIQFGVGYDALYIGNGDYLPDQYLRSTTLCRTATNYIGMFSILGCLAY